MKSGLQRTDIADWLGPVSGSRSHDRDVMSSSLLEQILQCPSLPSLPAVALKVLEQTNDPNITFKEMAKTIQNDQGLSAKVLKTVNSSFYGLRQRCTTIEKAISMLGMAPVKSIVLGFSLVHSLSPEQNDPFDYIAYWRRGLYSGVAARLIAQDAAMGDAAEEAFLGGLLQDIGMMALYRALGSEYLKVLDAAEGDHRQLVKHELAFLELQHPDLGAMLAQRWKLPDELVVPVKYHERPTAAPATYAQIARAVGLGNIIHDVLTDAQPSAALQRAYAKGKSWFAMSAETVVEMVERVSESSREMAQLFRLDTGPFGNTDEILDRAREQRDPDEADADALVIDSSETDPLTGVYNRSGYNSVVRSAYTIARSKHESMGLAMVVVDGLAELCAAGPEGVDGEIAMSLTAMLRRLSEPMQGVVCRLSADVFALVVSGIGEQEIGELGELIRSTVQNESVAWVEDAGASVTVSVGTVAIDGAHSAMFSAADQLSGAALTAASRARQSGGNTVCVFETRRAA